MEKQRDGKIVLIDEISPDVLRVCRGFKSDGERIIKNRNQVPASEFIDNFLCPTLGSVLSFHPFLNLRMILEM